MLQNVIVTNYLGEELTLSMKNPELSGFYIKSIDGLGPAKANINTTDIVSQDGSMFNSARSEKRNIVIKMGPYNSPDVEESRLKIYKMFPIKRKIKLQFESDNSNVFTYGFVESNEPDIFSKNVMMDISIICPFPYFTSAYENSITFKGDDREHVISYDGDVETGLTIMINFSSEAKGFKIINHGKDYFAIDSTYLEKVLPGGFKENDILTIKTIVNEKSIILTRDEEEINLLNALDRTSKWLKIGKGNNTFTIEAEEGLEDLYITMSSSILYEGV